MREAGPDACYLARELAAEAGPARQQPKEEQQQQSHSLADECGGLAGAHLAGDVVFLGTAKPRVPFLQRYVAAAVAVSRARSLCFVGISIAPSRKEHVFDIHSRA